MTRQEMFDKSVQGMIDQGRLAKTSSGKCAYRKEVDGVICSCVIGQLIDDETANSWDSLEVSDVMHISYRYTVDGVNYPFSSKDTKFLSIMQLAHDGSQTLNEFLDKAKGVADQFDLDFKF